VLLRADLPEGLRAVVTEDLAYSGVEETS